MSDETSGAAMSPQDLALAAAIRRYEERLSKDPASLGFALLADLYRKAGRVDEAVATCREGLGRHPHYATARLILAKALVGRQDFTEALSEIDTILRVNPKDVQCHRLAAEMYRPSIPPIASRTRCSGCCARKGRSAIRGWRGCWPMTRS